MVMVLINRRFTSSINFHDVLHGFRAGRGTDTASLEAKLFHQLMPMRDEVLYAIFMYLHKSYDALDRDRCLEII